MLTEEEKVELIHAIDTLLYFNLYRKEYTDTTWYTPAEIGEAIFRCAGAALDYVALDTALSKKSEKEAATKNTETETQDKQGE